MADHYRKSLTHVDQVECSLADLTDEYSETGGRREVVARLHQQVGAGMKLAQIHADLAIAQSLRDLATLIEAGR